MTQSLTNLYPEMFSRKALSLIHGNIVMPRLITTAFDPSAEVRGDTINMFLPATSTPTLNTADSVSYSDHSFTKKTVTINKWLYDKKYLSDKDLALALYTPEVFIKRFIEPMALGFANYIDKAIMQLYKDIYYREGTVNDPPDAIADVKAVYKRFRTLKLPQPWHVVLSPTAYVDFMVDQVLKANERGNKDVVDTGDIIRFMGMQIWLAQNLDESDGGLHTAGAWGTTPLTDDASTATGDTDSHADGLDDSECILTGDLFTIAEDTVGQYVVTANATGSGNEADFNFLPGMIQTGGWGDSKAITIAGKGSTYINNLAFNPEAFGIAFAKLGTAGEMFGGCVQSEIVQDNIPIRVTIGYDHTKPGPFVMLDNLWGVGTIRPEMAFRILG